MEGYIYLSIFIFVILLVGILSAIVSKKVLKEELKNSNKLDISIEQMENSEKNIDSFYRENNLEYGVSVWEIAELLHVKQGPDDPRIVDQAYISKPDVNGNMTVTFREGVPYEKRKFIFAHECAHIINKDPLPNARPDGRNKSIVEQLADYTAAAILMPINEIRDFLEKTDYENLSSKKRVVVIKTLCKKYEVSRIIALRRINEIGRLTKY